MQSSTARAGSIRLLLPFCLRPEPSVHLQAHRRHYLIKASSLYRKVPTSLRRTEPQRIAASTSIGKLLSFPSALLSAYPGSHDLFLIVTIIIHYPAIPHSVGRLGPVSLYDSSKTLHKVCCQQTLSRNLATDILDLLSPRSHLAAILTTFFLH